VDENIQFIYDRKIMDGKLVVPAFFYFQMFEGLDL